MQGIRPRVIRRASLALLAVASVGLAGCGGDARTPAATPPRTTATATPEASVPTRRVTFRAADGQRVTAEFTANGRRAPAVVLLHEIDGGYDQFDTFVPELHAAGFATLAYQSRDDVSELERLPDLTGAIDWLRGRRGVDRARIGAVGASIGALTGLVAIADSERGRLRAAVALSPVDSPELWDVQESGRYRPHDVLFISDEREASAVDNAIQGAIRSKAIVAEDPGHGVALLPQADVRDAVLSWLRQRVAG